MKNFLAITIFLATFLQAFTIDEAQSALENEEYKKAYYIFKAIVENSEDETGEANYELARMYDYGCAVRQNISEAVKYYEKAAKLGNIEAKRNLGSIYHLGEDEITSIKPSGDMFDLCTNRISEDEDVEPNKTKVKQDYKKAVKYLNEAVKEGNDEESRRLLEIICDSKKELCKKK